MYILKNIKYKDILEIDYLEIPVTKVSSIVGPSGGGKTTLLKVLNNLITPDDGSIFYLNQDIEKIDPIELRSEVMMLAQKPIIFAKIILDHFKEVFKLTDRSCPKEEELRRLLEVVHLKKALNQSAEKLSGGEKQRLALATILALKPKVLLLDEPSSALDERTENLVIEGLVNYIKDKGISLIMVTHAMAIAQKYADKIIRVVDGKIAKERVVDGRVS